MKTTRSPRFPFISLEQAIQYTRLLYKAFKVSEKPEPKTLVALGFSGASGKANKVLAALNSYKLISVTKVRGRQFRVSPLGARIARMAKASRSLRDIRMAALSPPVFALLWQNRAGIVEKQIENVLRKSHFTRKGAHRAAQIYLENIAFADLEDPKFRASSNNQLSSIPIQSKSKSAKVPSIKSIRQDNRPKSLRIPLSRRTATIPIGITEKEYRLLMRTLRSWKESIISDDD